MFLSNKLQYLLVTAEISGTQLAQNINVSPTTISEILNGVRTNPRPETVHALAQYFGVDISEFYDDEITKELSDKNTKKIYFPNLKAALSHLLIKTGIISTASLHKLSGIPKHTLDRILNEETLTPNISTLKRLAQFFNLTIPQLRGMDPIYSSTSSSITLIQKMLPLIKINDLEAWLSGVSDGSIEHINVSRKIIGEKAFALLINTEEFEPDYDINTIIVIDNDTLANDNDFILTSIKGKPSIYELSNNLLRKAGTTNYVKKPTELCIYGIVIQEIINKKGY